MPAARIRARGLAQKGYPDEKDNICIF
jgi:hypothetical protein